MQWLITSDNRVQFEERVNDLLANGWKVVPTTLVAAISGTEVQSRERFLVVLEEARK